MPPNMSAGGPGGGTSGGTRGATTPLGGLREARPPAAPLPPPLLLLVLARWQQSSRFGSSTLNRGWSTTACMDAHCSSILSKLPTSYASPGLPDRAARGSVASGRLAVPPYGGGAVAEDGATGPPPKAPGAVGLEHEDCDEPAVAAVLATSGVAGHWVDEDDDEEEDEDEDDEDSDGGAGVDDPNAIWLRSGVVSLSPRSAWLLSSSASFAASLWRPWATLGGVRRSPGVLLSPLLVSVSMDSSWSLANLGVDAGWSGLESGGERGDRMGDPPGTLPFEEEEALSVTTSFHELATDSLVARWCWWSPGELLLSNRFSNMGCTAPRPRSSSSAGSSRPPVRLRSAASASRMRRASSSSAEPPPLPVPVPPLPVPPLPVAAPKLPPPLLFALPSAPVTFEDATAFGPGSPRGGVGVLVAGELGAGGAGGGAAGATVFPPPVAAVTETGTGGGSAFSRERAASSSQGRAALRLAPADAAAAPSSHSALRFLLVSCAAGGPLLRESFRNSSA